MSDLALRLRSCERVRSAIEALAELGPASQIIDRCAFEAAEAADLDRLVVSRIDNGALSVERLHLRDAGEGAEALLAELRLSSLRLSYPLIESELVRRREARLVTDIDPAQPARFAFLDTMGWQAYVAAPIVVDGDAVGFLHGDRAPGRRPLTALDAESLEHFAAGFAIVFERAVLRHRLRDQQHGLRRIAAWAESVTADLSDGAIALSADREQEHEARPSASAPVALANEEGLSAHLTPREIDVLRLLAEGKTNGDIARTLFVAEGTVKFHVKNILRKMQASNRSDAGSRYLRLTLRDRSAAASPILR